MYNSVFNIKIYAKINNIFINKLNFIVYESIKITYMAEKRVLLAFFLHLILNASTRRAHFKSPYGLQDVSKHNFFFFFRIQ